MPLLPEPFHDNGGRSPRQLAKAVGAQEKTELDLFNYELDAHLRGRMDQIDTQEAGDAFGFALSTELSMLRKGKDEACQSAAALELVFRKTEQFANHNARRQARRFG